MRATRYARLRHGPHRGSSSIRPAFTLVEFIIAVVIMTVGVLGLAGTASFISRQIGGAAQETLAADVAATRFELVRSTQCSALPPSGTASTRGMAEHWTNALPVLTVPGTTGVVFVTDTVRYTAAGNRQTDPFVFKSYVPCL